MSPRTVFACAALFLAQGSDAHAADAWVDRPITLPRATIAIDTGLGLGTSPRADLVANSYTGAGANVEASWGIYERFEVGLRIGPRLDVDGRAIRADAYARTFDLETYGTRNGNPSNPELRAKYAFVRLDFLELAGELRAYVPIESGSREGVMFGFPIAVHYDHLVRIDTGAYFPILFYSPISSAASIPVHVWFQTSPRFWVGPMTGLTFVRGGPSVVAGVGFGVQINSWFDVRVQLVEPEINHTLERLGLGIGFEFRLENLY